MVIIPSRRSQSIIVTNRGRHWSTMFNTPRQTQRYGTSGSFTANNGLGSASFIGEDPLANSTYDGLDPWSSAPSPELPPPPSAAPPSPFASVLGISTSNVCFYTKLTLSVPDESKAPSLYHKAFAVVDPSGAGETSINSLSRVLLTSGVSASTIDRVRLLNLCRA